MTLGSKEFYEMMQDFEKAVSTVKSARLDREDKSVWHLGRIYQHGEVNDMFKGFQMGYGIARLKAIQGEWN